MNIQRLPEYLIRWTATLGGIGVVLFLAKAAGEGRIGLVILVLVLFFAGLATLAAKERIWVAVPVAWGLLGKIPALNIPFSVRDLVVFWVCGAFLLLLAFKVIRRKPVFRQADLLVGVMLVYLAVGFIRNPVGFESLGSDRVGGRPYYNIFVAVLAYWVLVRSSLHPRAANRQANAMVTARLFDGVTAQLLHWIPPLIPVFALCYVSDFHDALDSGVRINPSSSFYAESTERLGYLAAIGHPLLYYLAARYPLTAFLNPARPWRMALLLIGVVSVLLSGFRSTLLICAAAFAVCGYFHKGRREVVRMAAIGFFLLIMLVLGNGTIFNLPLSAQRALSRLPGKWDPVAIQDAKGSTQWRTEMWDQMLKTNRYIDNHWLGDGFGFKRRDYEQMAWAMTYGGGAAQEDFMVTGGVHSGPVSTIRYAGYIGLALHLVILIVIANEAWKACRRATGTPYQMLTYFVCVPLVLEPPFFVFVFGAFENSVPQVIFSLGFLRMLQNSFEDYMHGTKSVPFEPLEDALKPLKLDAPVR